MNDENKKYGIGYEPKNEIEKELYENIEEDDSKEEKFYIINFECSSCGYENDIGVKKGIEEFECPSCEKDVEIKWGDKN